MSISLDNDKIKPSRERKRAQAAMALAGVKYKDIAVATCVKAKPGYEPQAVYASLMRPSGQQALREMSAKMYDQGKIRRIINDCLDAIKPSKVSGPQARVIEIAAKTEAMLTERNLNENSNIDATAVKSAQQLTQAELEAELLSRLRLSNLGINTSLSELEPSIRNTQHDEGLDSTAQVCEDNVATTDTV